LLSALARTLGIVLLGGTMLNCAKPEDTASPPREGAPAFDTVAPVLTRLTTAQYANSIADLFGEDVVVARSLEPDTSVDGLLAVGASITSLSAWGVEQYERTAFDIADQVMADAGLYGWFLSCTPEGEIDSDCASEALEIAGRFTWRRPLTSGELDRLVDLADGASSTLGDFHEGLAFGLAALLQSPHFLYRVVEGKPVDGERAYTDWEMASRLSFFLWNTTPDADLLAAAEAGELTDSKTLGSHVDRMLEDPRAIDGARNIFSDLFHLYDLEDLSKDTTIFPFWTPDVKSAAREETLRLIETWIFEDEGDYRDLFTSTRTFVDRRLAALYGIPAPLPDGFGEVTLDKDQGRRGLLGHISLLALNSHPVSTSVTRRGQFVREVLLCQPIPPPPSGVDTSIPAPDENARTMRERVKRHLEDPVCASCHQLTDPVGLGLENFDAIGLWREMENEAEIDPSGDIDGEQYDNAWGLGAVLSQHERLPACLVESLYRFSQGRSVTHGEDDLLDWHASGFAESGFSVKFLLRDLAVSPGFRQVGEVSE
jgi:hypothetical protein